MKDELLAVEVGFSSNLLVKVLSHYIGWPKLYSGIFRRDSMLINSTMNLYKIFRVVDIQRDPE